MMSQHSYKYSQMTVWLTSCLTGLDSAVQLNRNFKQICLFGQNLTGQTGGQLYSEISSYEVSECSLTQPCKQRQWCIHGAFQQKEVKARICRIVLVIVLLFWNFINASAYHFGQYKPQSFSTKELHSFSYNMLHTTKCKKP